MAEFKQVEKKHLEYLCRYLGRKVADGKLAELLEDPDTQGAAIEALEKVLRNPGTKPMQKWFDDFLSRKGREKVWIANRNIPHRERNPRGKQELHKPVMEDVMSWAKENGIDNLNEAVLALLAKAKHKKRKAD